jgi:hypothetical protein
MKPKKIVVLGYMGAYPIAGVIWQHIHYVVGLQRLGHDVYYIEDSARLPYNPIRRMEEQDYAHAARTLESLAAKFEFRERWAFRARYLPGYPSAGLSGEKINALYREADAILNVCGWHELHQDLLASARIIMVESDPGFGQIRVDQGDAKTIENLQRHRRLFTFGENIGTARFPVPLHGFEWLPTRQPVVTELWDTPGRAPAENAFTTITNWSASETLRWRGKTYLWSKSEEFMKFVDAPACTGAPFELVSEFPDATTPALFARHGWRLLRPEAIHLDLDRYRGYVQNSRGEFTASKQIVIAMDTGWFSDRSACYLAAGRPVITQQTGFTRLYGGERGLFAFSTMEEIVEAVRRIQADYAAHAQAAREIAKEFFEAEKVLKSLLERAGV